MSDQHTHGRLHVCSHAALVIRDGNGRWVASTNAVFRSHREQEDNASRLVACWNACEGLTQDHFDGDWTALGLSKYAKSLEGKISAARTLLSDALETFDDNPMEDHEVADRIRDFLGKS